LELRSFCSPAVIRNRTKTAATQIPVIAPVLKTLLLLLGVEVVDAPELLVSEVPPSDAPELPVSEIPPADVAAAPVVKGAWPV